MTFKKPDALNILFATVSSFAIFCTPNLPKSASFMAKIQVELNGIGIEGAIVMAALCVLFYKKGSAIRNGFQAIPAAIAAIFSAFMLIGRSYSVLGNWNFIFADVNQFIIALIVFAGYFLLFYLLLSLLFKWIGENDFTREPQKISWLPDYVRKHPFAVSFAVIIICWLPYLIAFFPGSVPHDGFHQLRQVLGLVKPTEQHPYITSLFFGCIFRIGRVISDNCGIALLVSVLSIIEASCYAWVCVRLRQWKVPESLWLLFLVFYAVVPLFGMYAHAVIKDSLFFAFFALYMVEYIEICRRKVSDESQKMTKEIVFFTLCSILVCLCRNNGIHVVFPANLCLIFTIGKKSKFTLLVSLLAIIFVYGGYKGIMLPALKVSHYSAGEILSIPLQQTARYLKYYPSDVTEKERKAIAKILDIKKITKNYDPNVSDPVKGTLKNGSLSNGKDYLKAWYCMFLRHPCVYFEATLNNTYGYIYPFANINARGPYQAYIKWSVKDKESRGLDIKYFFGESVRGAVKNWALAWRDFPLIAQIVNPGTYTWLLIIIAGLILAYCAKWNLVVLVSPFFNVLVCIASPVNGLLRYAWPVAAAMPAIIWWLVICLKSNRAREN